MHVDIFGDVWAHIIYLEGLEYPEYVLQMFYLIAFMDPNYQNILSLLVFSNKQYKMT